MIKREDPTSRLQLLCLPDRFGRKDQPEQSSAPPLDPEVHRQGEAQSIVGDNRRRLRHRI
jgi:hypothetical protein